MTCNECKRAIVYIIISLSYSFFPGTFIAISYGCTGYELYTYACIRVNVHGATRAQGTDSFKGVIFSDSFESVFWMDTVEVMHVCTCMCTVHILFKY